MRISQSLLDKYAGRGVYFHGTSSTFLQTILSEGLNPNPSKRTWDEARDDTSGYDYGGRGMESFGGVYFTSNRMTAYSAAGNAVKKFGGNRVIIAATLETRTPGVALDEDHFISFIEDKVGRTFNEAFDSYKFELRAILDDLGIGGGLYYLRSEEQIRALYDKLNSYDYSNLANMVFESFMSVNRANEPIQKRFNLQKDTLIPLLGEVIKAYMMHLFERWFRQYAKDETDRYDNKPPELTNTIQVLKDKLNEFMGKIPEISLNTDSFMHNIRVNDTVGYSGKNRILCVIEIKERKDLGTWRDEPEKKELTYSDVIVHHGGLSEFDNTLRNVLEKDWGGAYRLIIDGKPYSHNTGYYSWPDSIWGPNLANGD